MDGEVDDDDFVPRRKFNVFFVLFELTSAVENSVEAVDEGGDEAENLETSKSISPR